MVYLLSAFERLECPHHFCSMAGVEPVGGRGGEAFSPSPSMLTPYSPVDTQAQQYGGGCKVEQRAEAGSTCSGAVSGALVDYSQVSFPPPSFPECFWTLRSSLTTREGRMPTPTCCSSSLTKGTISEPHWLVSNSWLFTPSCYIGTLAMSIPWASIEQVVECKVNFKKKMAGGRRKAVGKAKFFGLQWFFFFF